MKKKYWMTLAAGAAMGVWCIHRNQKYPVLPEFGFANKLAVPGYVLSMGTAKLANRALSQMALPLLPQGIERCGYQIPSEDGESIHLTVYRPEAVDWAVPCLVYFHGGGFCFGDQGYIHRYVARYAQGAQCAVVFVHYRTSDIAAVWFKKGFMRSKMLSDK